MQNTGHINEFSVLSLYFVQYQLNGPIVKNNGNRAKSFASESLYCSTVLRTRVDYFVKLKTWLRWYLWLERFSTSENISFFFWYSLSRVQDVKFRHVTVILHTLKHGHTRRARQRVCFKCESQRTVAQWRQRWRHWNYWKQQLRSLSSFISRCTQSTGTDHIPINWFQPCLNAGLTQIPISLWMIHHFIATKWNATIAMQTKIFTNRTITTKIKRRSNHSRNSNNNIINNSRSSNSTLDII